jgi:hypothetical protein
MKGTLPIPASPPQALKTIEVSTITLFLYPARLIETSCSRSPLQHILGTWLQVPPTNWGTKVLVMVISSNKGVPYLIHKPITALQGAMGQTNPSGILTMFILQSKVTDMLDHSPTTPSQVGAQECVLSLRPRLHFRQDRGASCQRHPILLLQIYFLPHHHCSICVDLAKLLPPRRAPFICERRRRYRGWYPMVNPEPSQSQSNYQIEK